MKHNLKNKTASYGDTCDIVASKLQVVSPVKILTKTLASLVAWLTLRVDILGESASSTRSPASITGTGYAEKAEESRNTSTFVRE
jgi:hypothetical protein